MARTAKNLRHPVRGAAWNAALQTRDLASPGVRAGPSEKIPCLRSSVARCNAHGTTQNFILIRSAR